MKYAEAQRCGTNSSFKWSYSHDNTCQLTRNTSRNIHFYGIILFQSWICIKFSLQWYIDCWGLERKKSVDVSVLVISMDALFKIFSKNELKNVLTKFHDFIINLNYLALSSLTRNRFKFVYSFYRVFGMKCPLDCLWWQNFHWKIFHKSCL